MGFCYAITLWPLSIVCKFLWALSVSIIVNMWGAVQFPLAAWRKYKNPPQPTHGNAKYEDDKSLRKRGYLGNHGFLACVTDKGRKVFTSPERTVVMLAPPGSGKSQHFLADLRAKMKRPDDKLPHLIIGDAADELYQNSAKDLAARGYQIFKIDLVEPEAWSKYDVLSGLDPSVTAEVLFGRQLDAICRLFVPDEPHSKQPHFYEFARLMVKCAITINVKYEGNNKPIGDILSELIDEDGRDEMIKRSKKYGDPIVTSTLKVMAKMQDKPEGLSMMSTSLRKLEGWLDPAIREITAFGEDIHGKYSRGWRFEQMLMHDKPVALFIHSGTNETAAGPMVRLIYGNAINAVSTLLDTGKAMPRDLEVMVDEAGLAGNCAAISHAYNRLRKAGVRIRMCFLGLTEFKETYPNAMKILAGSDLVVFGGSNEQDLNQYASDLAGEYTVHSKSESESSSGESRGRSEQPRRLIKPSEVRGLAYDKALVFIDNLVVLGKKPWRKGKNGIEFL
ncbi:Type IV secretory pathway VirD4 protein-like protein [Rhizobium leguminosarum bv. trifolii WSM2304]|uniref:Type IV secretory pathway VirD4 protein-like protein n=1 Tax=Rhizobium leguminosarum bv. trifolii (strain WSM2304) TaxID=395492 RepID=A0ABF7QKH5_RHILW|nr:type IV secretory system conjugative DNA transfer family protein [Rhizobium leguminosarum]ACI54457.1 Type IV secretory pathway VirD4 protein-like protein [Rhizobium leguminosarum bv. trifolii WSM2304]